MSTLIAENPARVSITRPRVTIAALLTVNTVALVAVAVLLRGWQLGNIPGVNGDEAWSGVQALRLVKGQGIDWWTPSGNPVNWFFLLPMAALHSIWPPSFVLLRVTPLVGGLAALVVNYFLCRRAFDSRTAVVSTVLLALMPINIAYSRFAWDASQTLLVTLLVLYLPLIQCHGSWASTAGQASRGTFSGSGDWPSVWAMVALAVAVLVHPTNLFAAPLLVAGVIWLRRGAIVRAVQKTAVPAKTGMLVALVIVSACGAYWVWRALAGGALALHGPRELPAFATNYLWLLSGTTVYDFISGAGSTSGTAGGSMYTVAATNVAFATLAVAGFCGMWRRLAGGPHTADVALVVGWLMMLTGFFLVAGPGAIAAHFERYGICLVAPAAVVLARGLVWWTDHTCRSRKGAAIALSVLAWLWPASFYLNYFEFIELTGGTSHVTFRTAAVEPKQTALRFILEHRDTRSPTRIVCSQWWNYWPVEYLAFDALNVEVLTWPQWQRAVAAEGPCETEKTWFIEFADGSLAETELAEYQAAGVTFPRKTILDYAGTPLILVFGPPQRFSQNY